MGVAVLVQACGGGSGGSASTASSTDAGAVTTAAAPTTTVTATAPAAPTVLISSAADASVATGATTFTFQFSQAVSSSFGLANVVVSNGSATALTMVSPTFATLLVQPASYATGTLTVSVSAGQFANAVSGANLQSASDAVAFNTTGGPSMVGWAMDWSDE